MGKQDLIEEIADEKVSAIAKYRNFFVGQDGVSGLLKYELAAWLARGTPGALGYWLRSSLYSRMCGQIGAGVQWGQNVALRHASKMQIGANSAFDDECILDARGAARGEFVIGESVLVARGSTLLAKSGFLRIGNHSTFGSLCYIGSAGGISIGEHVGVGGHCYIGGGRYRGGDLDTPILRTPSYSEGPINIGDGTLIGAFVCILDGATIGKGCLIGAGSVVREDIPDYMVVTPHQRLVMVPREETKAEVQEASPPQRDEVG